MAVVAQKLRLLLSFIISGDDERFSIILRKIHNVDVHSTFNYSALHHAVLYNRVEMTARLLSRNADMHLLPVVVNIEDVFVSMNSVENLSDKRLFQALKMSPICVCMLTKSKEMQKLLFGNIDKWTYSQQSDVLDAAILFGDIRIVDLIMKHGGDKMGRMLERRTPSLSWGFQTTNMEMEYTIKGKIQIDISRFSVENFKSPRILRLLRGNIRIEPRVFRKIKKIISSHPSMLWHRENKKYTGSRYTTREQTGNTPLAVLLETMQRLKESLREKSMMLQDQDFMDLANAIPNIFLTSVQNDIDVMKQNILLTSSSLEMWIWHKMVQTLRLAMGMSIHHRLGNMEKCRVSILGNDMMDFIFEIFLKTVSDSEKMYMVS
jgi:hypothetical protein